MDKNVSTKVLIFTQNHRIEGRISLVPDSRLTDFVHHAGPFIAVSDAKVCLLNGIELFSTAFLDLGTAHIELITPMDSIIDPAR